MKTLSGRIHYMALLAVLILSLPSCDVDVEFGRHSLGYRENTEYLCRYVWVDEWIDDYGDSHYQELRFYPDNTGEDYIRVRDRYGFVQEYHYRFVWDWYDAFYESIRLDYGGGDYSYMDHIQMYDRRLDCMLDGYPAYFNGYW